MSRPERKRQKNVGEDVPEIEAQEARVGAQGAREMDRAFVSELVVAEVERFEALVAREAVAKHREAILYEAQSVPFKTKSIFRAIREIKGQL